MHPRIRYPIRTMSVKVQILGCSLFFIELVFEMADRKCPKCGEVKDLERFSRSRSEPLGRSYTCKECKRQYNQEHKQEIQSYMKTYNAQYHKEHAQKIADHHKVYRSMNRDALKASRKVWQTNNMEHIVCARRTRRALTKRVLFLPFTPAQVRARDKRICQICKKKINGDIHYDHWIPLSAGGPHCLNNIRCTHPRCNLEKGSKVPLVKDLPEYLVGIWEISRALSGMSRLRKAS